MYHCQSFLAKALSNKQALGTKLISCYNTSMSQYLKRTKIEVINSRHRNRLKGQVREAKQVYEVFKDLKDRYTETSLVVCLDARLRAISYNVLSVGKEHGLELSSQDVFGLGYGLKAKYFIIVNNHPTGTAEPEREEIMVIQKLEQQSHIMEITMLDFIIIGALDHESDKNYWSLTEDGITGKYSAKTAS